MDGFEEGEKVGVGGACVVKVRVVCIAGSQGAKMRAAEACSHAGPVEVGMATRSRRVRSPMWKVACSCDRGGLYLSGVHLVMKQHGEYFVIVVVVVAVVVVEPQLFAIVLVEGNEMPECIHDPASNALNDDG